MAARSAGPAGLTLQPGAFCCDQPTVRDGICGCVASGLVLAAFNMKEMIPPWVAALDLTPIRLLHALLPPLNGYRLLEAAKLQSRIEAIAVPHSLKG